MNKFKKLVAVLVSVVMACVFATSAFAAPVADVDKAKAELKAYLSSNGVNGMENVVDALSADDLGVLRDNQATLTAELNKVKSAVAASTSESEAQKAVAAAKAATDSIFAQAHVTVVANVAASASEITVVPVASVVDAATGKAVTGNATVSVPLKTDTKSDNNTNTSSNNNSNKSTAAASETISAASNPITASSTAVIKATGDNGMMVLATAVLAVVGVLGLAVRKEHGMAL